jgi:hypothetical protein
MISCRHLKLLDRLRSPSYLLVTGFDGLAKELSQILPMMGLGVGMVGFIPAQALYGLGQVLVADFTDVVGVQDHEFSYYYIDISDKISSKKPEVFTGPIRSRGDQKGGLSC